MCIHWQLKLCSNPPKWMTRLIVWKVCQDGIQLYKELENLWGIAGMKTINEYPIRWKLLQLRVKPTELLSCRLLWGRNLLSRHLVFIGMVQKIRLHFGCRASGDRAKCTEEGCDCFRPTRVGRHFRKQG